MKFRSLREAVAAWFGGTSYARRDVRYSLADVLHSELVRKEYQLIIIDCPPRLTTSEVQAFCASTHLLIPTILNRPSADAVISLCRQVEVLKRNGICPYLKYLGVVGTMVTAGAAAAGPAMQLVVDALAADDIPTGFLPPETFVPDRTQVVNVAANGIAYIASRSGDDGSSSP
jgi:chromosome partitioning protein